MAKAAALPADPSAEQLEEMHRRKDRIASDIRDNVHEAWALSWLAVQSHEANRSDHSDEKHREATYVALTYVVSLLEEARTRHDEGFTGVHRAVMTASGGAS